MADKEIRVNVRVAGELKEGVRRVYDATGVDETTLVRAALESIVRYFDEHGEITLPLATVPKSYLKKKRDEPKILRRMGGTGNTPFTDSTQKSQYPQGEETLHAQERETLPLAAESHKRETKPKAKS